MRAIKLGRASMRCGSCSAVVAKYTDTLSPPSSCARAPHSGSQANTLSAAVAGRAMTTELNATTNLRIVFMFVTLEFVGAVRAQTHDVLEKYLMVGRVAAGLVARRLQADATELARAPIDHHRMAGRGVRGGGRGNRPGGRGWKSCGSRNPPCRAEDDPPPQGRTNIRLPQPNP